MHLPLVMTIIGPDRTGLVETLASLVAGHGGNWLESRMSHLGGQFAGILRLHVPADKKDALLQALQDLSVQGLTVVAQADTSPAPPLPVVKTLVQLEILTQDRPGIVHQISQALKKHGVNVEELHTECTSAPMSGETLFKAKARLFVPAGCAMTTLRQELEKIAQDLMADLSLSEIPAGK